jgi:hypothetical protein
MGSNATENDGAFYAWGAGQKVVPPAVTKTNVGVLVENWITETLKHLSQRFGPQTN